MVIPTIVSIRVTYKTVTYGGQWSMIKHQLSAFIQALIQGYLPSTSDMNGSMVFPMYFIKSRSQYKFMRRSGFCVAEVEIKIPQLWLHN